MDGREERAEGVGNPFDCYCLGMDEKNERKVWAMLLQVCRQYQAQYFYMAPKFPRSLPFDDQVRQHLYYSVVYSDPVANLNP
jgi:hypothetical protein